MFVDGVGVQDHFHYDGAEDSPAQAKGPQREEREEWLIPLFMSKNGLHWEELGIRVSFYANPELWRRKADSFLWL